MFYNTVDAKEVIFRKPFSRNSLHIGPNIRIRFKVYTTCKQKILIKHSKDNFCNDITKV